MNPRVVVLHNRPGAAAELSETGVLDEVRDVAAALEAEGHAVEAVGVDRSDLFAVMTRLAGARDETVVFNLCEGLEGEARHEPTVAGLLDLHGVRYTGNPAPVLTCALDKRITKAILFAAGIPTPGAQVFRAVPRPEVVRDMAFPVVVKPLREDASLGVTRESFVTDAETLCRRVAHVLETFHQPALAEVYLEGREFNVAVVGSGAKAKVLPVAEICFEGYAKGEPRLVTHEGKWAAGSEDDRRTVPRCPAEVGENLKVKLETVALASYRALECRDYARLDLRLDGRGRPQVLEVNPNPDISRSAGLARAVLASGDRYEAFLDRLVEGAWTRS